MPEFLSLLPPDEARELLFSKLDFENTEWELVDFLHAANRVSAEDIFSPHPLPNFSRSSVDGYAVRARDTYGANESMPAYLNFIGEIGMGTHPEMEIGVGSAILIHTGGMLPAGADAVVMLEYVQRTNSGEVEVNRPVATGENVIQVGEDVQAGELVLPKGKKIRPAEIGGLAALGITGIRVARAIRVGIISTGDEVVPPEKDIQLGQVRDVNSYTLAALVESNGGLANLYGIVPDQFADILAAARQALRECDLVLITAGSSASVRDMTADVINELGTPGVLVHGINTRPGKPTILGVCEGKAVIGLPGNPVSALVNGLLFVVPLLERLSLQTTNLVRASIRAVLSVNLVSQAGREDWHPVRLVRKESSWYANPIFGKSNLIFTISKGDGLICIPADATGLSAGEIVEVYPY
jgi:molybdopterin molybdotransferase